MTILWRIYFLFLFLCTPTLGEKQVNTQFSPVHKKPSDSDQIFTMQTSTISQCLYICIQNNGCLTVLYNNIGLLCIGYESQLEDTTLTGEEKVLRLVYKDHLIVYGCDDVRVLRQGIYLLNMTLTAEIREVFCEVKTNGSKWLVLMRRKDGSVEFDREWNDYKFGFGSQTGEFWSGNELIHKLTTDGRNHTLRVELESYDDEFIFAVYNHFWIGPESDNYRLHVSGLSADSTAGDGLSNHNNMMFSTKQRDNDMSRNNCAVKYGAPWWFSTCHYSLLTGKYGSSLPHASGITWSKSWGYSKFARSAAMMIRPYI
ncbi:hypothetical protein LSH36_888g00003 [Paralvinella palmiformis]|uniref:Fibrinogen C-terminal domain-containing protein n=1 Tax=Paralvinella palmiformis TaxID=53620 RepID=A0AAD9IZJ6_9ANNE|nr:hypothetical protein LSH36_888g00003 [Paralvinella palmiformis]